MSRMKALGLATGFVLLVFGSPVAFGAADTPELKRAAHDYTATAMPLVAKYCLKCHSTKRAEGDLDLERFATLSEVRKATSVWLKVAEMLDNGEMPPRNARKPSDLERRSLRGWVTQYLKAEALASAGDPGPVIIRRLSNAQYTYTLRDLTGVALDPAREFPVDGAAGEGFTNTGNALVMSPALLTKYFDAAKSVAAHAVPLPDGMRFSPSVTRRDWTNEAVASIRALYAEYADSGGGSQVNLQGIVFDTNNGGRLPLERYLAATLAERDALEHGKKSIAAVARDYKLSPKYLALLWDALGDRAPSLLLDDLRTRFRSAKSGDAHALAIAVAGWQARLWKFNSVGHIGKLNGPKSWLEPVSPLLERQEFRVPIQAEPGKDVTLYLSATPAGDGSAHDVVVWERPRLAAPGMPEILLKDLHALAQALVERRKRVFASAAQCLAAADEASLARGAIDRAALARKHGVAEDVLSAWFDYLGLSERGVTIRTHLVGKMEKASGYDFVNGWGPGETPNAVANASDEHVRVPGNLRPHSVAMHPSPTLRVAAGWQSPVAGVMRISGRVQHAHPECGNGVTWSLEVRRGATRQRLAAGVAHGPQIHTIGPLESIPVQPGDLVSIVLGPRNGDHSCDLTAVDLTLEGAAGKWDLAADVSPSILAGNPHADRQGHPAVWHFYTEPESGGEPDAVIPAGSILARWQSATNPSAKKTLARELQALLISGTAAAKNDPNAELYRQLISFRGPLFRSWRSAAGKQTAQPQAGADRFLPGQFGRLPDGRATDPANLVMQTPAAIAVTLPAELAAGCEFVTTGRVDDSAGEASAQLAISTARPELKPAADPARPVVTAKAGPAKLRFETAFADFRRLFPPVLCYSKIVPVDEVITLSLFYREDDNLRRLMLDDAAAARLDRLWLELRFISQDALMMVDAFQQLLEYASQDGDPRIFEPLRKPILDRAAAFRQALVDAEPRQLEAVIAFAERAYRRPLRGAEADTLRALYRKLRGEGLPHTDAWRLVLARVLVAPAFLYRVEAAAKGAQPAPVSDWELASRLSYFLWSSAPDDTLRNLAASGRLHDPDSAAAQARRMLKDEKIRRLATEFACQWLHVYEFDSLDEKSERHFPTFNALRAAMYEETIRFFADLCQTNRPVLDVLDSDHTFVNAPLAEHYGIPGVTGNDWRRVDGVKAHGRGGILGLASTLAKQSGASRTSPILRGNWISEVLLGEKLPKPPPGVPLLPEDESSTGGQTMRALVERHSRDPKCTTCHARIDPMGFALEAYDAIGRRRARDLNGNPIDAKAKTLDGANFEGLEGLRTYLLTKRREAVARQFSRKLLGYALGRGVALSDDPLLDVMTRQVASGGRIGDLIETIVRSPQFREIRGREAMIAQTP